MTVDQGGVAVVEEGLTEEQKAEQAAFEAEMAQETVEADAKAPESSTETSETSNVEPVVERKEVIKGFTEDEIRAALDQLPKLQKAIDTTAGTFGSRLAEQQQLITQLQAQRQAVEQLSPEKLVRLSQEYPELAEILASDLNGIIGQGGQSVAPDPKQIESIASSIAEQRILESERKRDLNALAKRHADWKETASFAVNAQNNVVTWKNPKFGEWIQKQSPDVAARITGQFDPDYVIEQLDKFKNGSKQKANDDIDVAVLPKGSRRQAVASSDLSEEEAAFRAEMARK
jgi:hypothetical protein